MQESWPKQKTETLPNGIMIVVMYERDVGKPFTPEHMVGFSVYSPADEFGNVKRLSLMQLGLDGYENRWSRSHGYMIDKDEMLDIYKHLISKEL
jgi:hypothetical protein